MGILKNGAERILSTTRGALQPQPLSAESGQWVEQTSTESAVFHMLLAFERKYLPFFYLTAS